MLLFVSLESSCLLVHVEVEVVMVEVVVDDEKKKQGLFNGGINSFLLTYRKIQRKRVEKNKG